MMGSMMSHEARQGHTDLIESVEKRVRAEFTEHMECSSQIINNLQGRLFSSAVKNRAQDEKLAEQDALIEQLAGAVSDLLEFSINSTCGKQHAVDTANDALKAVEEWRNGK